MQYFIKTALRPCVRKACAILLCGLAATAFNAAAQQTWVTVCADGNAGGYEAFPDICRLADGRLMTVFYAGYGHVSLPTTALPNGGRISFCTSADEGQTWSSAQTLFDGPYDDRDPSITQLQDGRLICTFFTLKPTTPGSSSYVPLGSFAVTSVDGGTTWESVPQQISTDYYCSSPVRELSDGRLILGLYQQSSAGAWGAVTISTNGGTTWGAPIIIPNGGLRYEAETDVIERKDGSLFAALRGRNHSGWSVSSDGGNTWSVAQLFGFPGHCHYLHRTPDDVIVMAHRLPNTSLHYSLDECQTWSENVVVDNVYGAYPSMVTLNDGSILIVYYEEGAGSNIRAKRFSVSAAGFEWLPVVPPVWVATRKFVNPDGGLWTNTLNWQEGILPVANEIADLSAATNTINLTVDTTVGEILFNPAPVNGTTNVLTILSDTAAPLSWTINLTSMNTRRIQVGVGAELRVDADLLSNGDLLKNGYGTLVVGQRLYATSPAALHRFRIEQGRVVNEGTISAPSLRTLLGTVEPESGRAPELVLRAGSAHLSTSTAYHNDVIWGGNGLLGSGAGSRAVVTHEGGVVNLTTNRTNGAFLNGYAAGGEAIYNLSGGEVNLSNKKVYVGFNGIGVINQSNGRFRAKELCFSYSSTGNGTYNLTGGELWLGGTADQPVSGKAAFNIGGASLYPFNKGFTISIPATSQFTGSGGPTRFCSEGSGFTNSISGFQGSGGFIKEGADTLNISGVPHSFSGPVIVSNGTVNVNVSMTGGNAVTLAAGNINLAPDVFVDFSSLSVIDGVFQMATNSAVVLSGSDPWVRIADSGTLDLKGGARLICLDVADSGTIDLSDGGTATTYRFALDGIEQPYGVYSASNCPAITGSGTLAVILQKDQRPLSDTFNRTDGQPAKNSLGETEVGAAVWSELTFYDAIANSASIVSNELRLGDGSSDPALALTGASWPNGAFSTSMRFQRVGDTGATVRNACGLILRRSISSRVGAPGDMVGAVHVQVTATGGLFLRENYNDNKYYKNPFTGSTDYTGYGAPGSLPTTINGLPFDADGDGRLGDDEPFELGAILSGGRLQVLINGEPIMAHNGFSAANASAENCAGFWKNRLSKTNAETHDSYHDNFSATNLPYLIRHIGSFDPNVAAERENWGFGGNTNLVSVGAITETIGGETVDAWKIDDDSTVGGSYAHYATTLSATEIADVNTNWWRFTMRLRVVNSNDAVDAGVSAQVATTTRALSLNFGSDASGNAQVRANSGSTHLVAGGSVYHTYTLEFNPTTSNANLFCDGTLLESDITGSSYSLNRIYFGANASPAKGNAHYALVQFEILPPPIPPPPGTLMILR